MKIIICTPIHDADHSNGILGLINLAQTLKKLGHHVKMCAMASGIQSEYPIDIKTLVTTAASTQTQEYIIWKKIKKILETYDIELLTDHSKKNIDDYIVLYPEVIVSNPLQAKNIIWYFGNKQGVLIDKLVPISSGDFILSHSKKLIENANHILFFAHINPLFNDEKTLLAKDRNIDVYYYGKGEIYTKPEPIEGAIEINRQWPSQKKDLAILLRNTRFLYTYDIWSSINLEAVLCGSVPVFLCNKPFTDEEIDGTELGEIPRVKFTDTHISSSFFEDFEFKRIELKNRIKSIQESWELNVKILVEKLTDHFQL